MAEREAGDEWASRSHPIDEDMSFQRGTWGVQRVAWVVLALALAAALLGLFHRGPLSQTIVRDGSGRVTVEYERFVRSGASDTITLALQAAREGEEMPLLIGAEFLEAFDLDTVRPDPISSSATPEGHVLAFRAAAPGPLRLHLGVTPQTVGLVTSRFGVAGGPAVEFWQLVYP